MQKPTLKALLCTAWIIMLGVLSSHAQFFTDFTTVPAGAYIPPGPIADPNDARIEDGILKLTLNANSAGGIFYVDDFANGAPVTKFRATFRAALFGSTCCGTTPADGFSFNLTPTAVDNPLYGQPAEEGLSTGLAVCFDTWDNGAAEAPAIDVKWDGVQVGTFGIQPSQSPTGGVAFLDVVINLDPDGTLDVSYGGRVIFSNLQTPYTPIAGGKWVMGARTGGANDNHWIDDLRINVFNPGAVVITNQPANTTVTVGQRARFSAQVDGTPPYTFQWFKDGVPIDGATTLSLQTEPVTEADDGARFQLRATNGLGFAISSDAVLRVNTDVTPPTIVSAFGSATFDRIVINFSEVLQTNNAADTFNFVPDGGLSVTNAYINRDGKSITLILDGSIPQQPNTLYTVVVNDIYDEANNRIAQDSTVQFRSYIAGCGLVLDTYLGISGTAVSMLTSHPNYPNNPQVRHYLTRFDTREVYPTDSLENYGGRIRGYFIPPESGNWIFYLRSDDSSQLFLNPNGPDAAGKVLLTEELACCTAFSAHASAPQALVGGQPYYIEALYKEGGGNDFCQVAAKMVGDPTNPNNLSPIPGAYLGVPAGPVEAVGQVGVASQPATVEVQQNTIATITLQPSNVNSAPVCYQWRRNGVDIPGAILPYYSFFATSADNGAVFTAALGVMGHSSVSGETTLVVTNDITPPSLLSAADTALIDTITLRFSELLDQVSAEAASSYTISGLTVLGGILSADGVTVTLTTSPQAQGATYTVVAGGVRDLAGNLADPAQNSASFRAWVASCGFLVFESYNTGGGVAVADLTGHPTFPNNPRERLYMTAFDTRTVYPDDSHENYGARVTGFFVPPVSGNYIFYLRSDDASQLFLNPAGLDPAGKILLTEETGCCQAFSAHASAPQPLVAGQMYYIEGLLKEGGGGDYLQVAAKLDTDPTPPNSLRPIGGGSLGIIADPTGATLAITDQPDDVLFLIDPAGASALFERDFNANNGGFTVDTTQPYDGPWVYDSASGSWREDGQAPENSRPNTSRLNSPSITVTRAGGLRLSFSHRYSFEGGSWDGGQVRISVNGGAYVAVPGSAFVQNGYNGTVLGNSASVLAGQPAYTENSPGYSSGFLTSIANLGSFNIGDTVSIQFIVGNDTNTRGEFIPNWQIDSVSLSEGIAGSPTATFSVAASGSSPFAPGLLPFLQWQRDSGAGFVDLPGVTGPAFTFVPTLADNGARYRAIAYLPGITVTSAAATLTVIQLNTPPRFTKGPDQTVPEDSGAHAVPNWATGIVPHSIDRVPIVYASSFTSLPPGSTLYGTGVVANGILHLTDANNGVFGGFYTPVVAAALESYNISYSSYVGGGTCCGGTTADGYSVNIANDLPVPPPGTALAEEGFGSGLSVTFDTWDNGGAEAPAIELKWLGSVIQVARIDVGQDNNPVRFSPVNIEVSALGIANVSYDGQLIFSNVTLAGWVPTRNLRLGFGARTGGANDNHWIDDLSITAFSPDASSAEAGQTVQFLVSNDNPSLFSAQPAVSPDGTLTYTVAPNACGQANVSVVAQDSGGTAQGGRDTSAPQTFVISVTPVNDCPTTAGQSVTAANDRPTPITLNAQDADANGCGAGTLSYAIGSGPTKGTLSGTPPSLTFTPNAGALGPDSFTFTVSDGLCAPVTGTVSINIVPGNEPPTTCVARIFPPTCVITSSSDPTQSVVSLNGSNACIVLVASAQDPDGDVLQFLWVTNGVPIAIGPVVTNCFDVGCHSVTLVVSDGTDTCSTTLDFCVVTPEAATEECVVLVDGMNLGRKNKRPLIASLKAASEAFARGDFGAGLNQLEALQNKVHAQLEQSNPAEAQALNECVQKIIDAVDCAAEVGLALGADGEEDQQ